MKIYNNSKKSHGFTLVELLVVITIIAVLVGLGVAGGQAAINKARKVTAQATATNIVTGIQQFYGDYSILPDPNGVDADNTGSGAHYSTGPGGDGTDIIEILSGLETGTNPFNNRKLKYLSIKNAENGLDGIDYNNSGASPTVNALYDPWGEPFYMVFDYDYDDRLEFIPDGNGGSTVTSPVNLNGQVAAVYSVGNKEPSEGTRRDVVESW